MNCAGQPRAFHLLFTSGIVLIALFAISYGRNNAEGVALEDVLDASDIEAMETNHRHESTTQGQGVPVTNSTAIISNGACSLFSNSDFEALMGVVPDGTGETFVSSHRWGDCTYTAQEGAVMLSVRFHRGEDLDHTLEVHGRDQFNEVSFHPSRVKNTRAKTGGIRVDVVDTGRSHRVDRNRIDAVDMSGEAFHHPDLGFFYHPHGHDWFVQIVIELPPDQVD